MNPTVHRLNPARRDHFFRLPAEATGCGWGRGGAWGGARAGARLLLEKFLRALPGRGADVLEAFPRRGEGLEAEDVWTGPESLFVQLGFEQVQEHPRRSRYRLRLGTIA